MELRPNRVKRKLEAGEPAFIAGNFTHADDIDSFADGFHIFKHVNEIC